MADNAYADFTAGGSLATRYLYGQALDQILARWSPSPLAGEGWGEGEISFYLTDRLGSVRANVSVAGVIEDAIAYDSFGGIVYESNPTGGDRFKFTAREWHATWDLYQYRERWFSIDVDQFLSEDPIYDDRLNPQRYVGNNPLNATDAEGLQATASTSNPSQTTVELQKRIAAMPRSMTGGGGHLGLNLRNQRANLSRRLILSQRVDSYEQQRSNFTYAKAMNLPRFFDELRSTLGQGRFEVQENQQLVGSDAAYKFSSLLDGGYLKLSKTASTSDVNDIIHELIHAYDDMAGIHPTPLNPFASNYGDRERLAEGALTLLSAAHTYFGKRSTGFEDVVKDASVKVQMQAITMKEAQKIVCDKWDEIWKPSGSTNESRLTIFLKSGYYQTSPTAIGTRLRMTDYDYVERHLGIAMKQADFAAEYDKFVAAHGISGVTLPRKY